MRIAHVTLDGGLPRYGIGLAVASLARAQARLGHDVRVLVRAENAAAGRAAAPEVVVAGLARRRGLLGGSAGYRRQVRAALPDDVDVVHVHTLVRMARWLLAPRARRGAPLVVTAHASDELGPAASPSGDATPARARRHARQAHRVLARADAIVAPSRFMARLVGDALARAGIAREATRVIGHGPTDERPRARAPHEGFVVTALARFVAAKGLDLLVDAFALAFGDAPEATLVLAGDGPDEPALSARVRRLGLEARVRFPGYVEGDARAALLAGTDVVAVPTRGAYETFGLAALDGRAAGALVLVASGGALPERVDDRSRGGGVVVGEETPEAWARALRAARGDAPGRAEAAARAGAVVADHSWEAAARAYEDVYRGLRG